MFQGNPLKFIEPAVGPNAFDPDHTTGRADIRGYDIRGQSKNSLGGIDEFLL
jgi:hypothetical protein